MFIKNQNHPDFVEARFLLAGSTEKQELKPTG